MKIFRDSIWGPMRTLFQADHRYCRKNGLYDFPQKRPGVRMMNLFLPCSACEEKGPEGPSEDDDKKVR